MNHRCPRGRRGRRVSAAAVVAFAIAAASAPAAEIRVGAASTDITPDRPVALDGQFATRVSKGIDNRLTASAVAIEAREGGIAKDHAVPVSIDLMKMLLGGHHDVALAAADVERLVTWMDANALFYGTFDKAAQDRQQRGERIEGPALE